MKLEGELLGQAHAKEDSETVIRFFDKGSREGVAKGEGWGEDSGEMAGNRLEADGWGEKIGEEEVFGGCVVHESEVEMQKGCFEVMSLLVVLGDMGRKW